MAFFCAKLLLTKKTSSDAALAVGVLAVEVLADSLPHIFIQKFGYPGLAADSILAFYHPSGRS